ncbi:MAG: hypothetical protein ACAH95_08930 [Fimbriimonas sp.]
MLCSLGTLSDDTDFAPPGVEHCQHVRLVSEGEGVVEIWLVLETHSNSPARLVSDQITASGVTTADVIWPAEGENAHASLTVHSDDGPRPSRWVRRSWRSQTINLSRQLALKEISIEPAELLFTPTRKVRRMSIANLGRMALEVKGVQATFGYRFVTEERMPRVLKPGERIHGLIQRTSQDSPTEGQVAVQFDDGMLAAPITAKAASEAIAVPPWTVGIDFGTSHTSIVVRKAGQRESAFLGPDGRERFPTAVYCPTPDEATWKYGPEAINEFKQSKRGKLILELKSHMQRAEEDLFDEWPGVTPLSVLSWYFRQLLLDLILPFFSDPSRRGALKRLSFIFSFPVYDGQANAELQRNASLEAAQVAGFEAFGSVDWAYEPVCAACYLLLGREGSALEPDERLMVFDSGGGTTDICMGTVSREGNGLTLRHITTGAATLSQGLQFGGGRITSRMGKKLFRKHGNNLKARVMLSVGEQDDQAPAFRHFLEHEPADLFGPEEVWPWPAKLPDFFLLADQAKVIQANAPEKEVVVYPQVPGPGGAGISLDTMMTQLTATEGMESIALSVKQFLRTENPQKVFAVGGNSLIPQVRKALALVAQRPIEEIGDRDRNLAVALGTVWVKELVLNTMEYGIIVRDGTGGVLSHYKAGSRPDPTPGSYVAMMPPGSLVGFEVAAELEEREAELFRPSIRNDSGQPQYVHVQFALEGGDLVMSHDLGGTARTFLKYSV